MMESLHNIRCAVIGTGAMGRKYAKMLCGGAVEGLRLTAVCCHSDAAKAWAASALDSSVLICGSEDALYEHQDLFDALLVVTPHRLHPAMTIRALKAGKHVMCDKPAGVTAADAARMSEAAEKTGRIYAMMCHQRAYAKHRKIKRLLDSREIGHVTRVSMINSGPFRTEYYHKSGSWRSSWSGEGGGALINQGHHLLDLWQWLFGLPEAIYADIPFGKYNDFLVDDEATLVMDYPSKMTGTFFLSTGEGSKTERLEIIGTKGRVLLDGNELTLTRFSRDTREYAATAQVTARQELQESTERFTFGTEEHAYETMLCNFAAAIQGREALIAPGSDGVNTLMLVNAAYLSVWEGKKLTLPIDGKRYLEELYLREKREAAL